MDKTIVLIKGNIRIYASNVLNVAKEAIKLQETRPLASLGLAQAISVFGQLAIMKGKGKVVSHLKVDGAFKDIIVDSNDKGHIRALISNPLIETDWDDKNINEIPLKIGMGNSGTLKIVNEYNNNNFGGTVDIVKGDMVTDLAYYFDQSEQIFTGIVSHVEFDQKKLVRCEGYIFQLLPGHVEEDKVWIEKFVANNKPSLKSFQDFVNDMNANKLMEYELKWKCTCSKEKIDLIKKMLSSKEKQDIIEKHGRIEINCNFCNKKYF